MSKNKTGKCLTYEEIGEKLKLSPQQVHKIEKEAFNKIVKRMSVKNNIFEVIINLSAFLGIDEGQCYKKLDKQNIEKLLLYIKENYDISLKGFVPSIAQNDLEDLFK